MNLFDNMWCYSENSEFNSGLSVINNMSKNDSGCEGFTHIKKRWEYDEGAFCRTETFVLSASRSEEPVSSNMDISTGHIVLVSTLIS